MTGWELWRVRGVLFPRLSKRSYGAIHQHIQGAELHIEQFGALFTAAIFQQPQSQNACVARIYFFEPGVDLLPEVRTKEPFLHGLRVGSDDGLEVFEVGPAQSLPASRRA